MFSKDKFMDYLGATCEGLLAASSNPAKAYVLGAGRRLRNVNLGGIWAADGPWLLRVDKPHANVDFHHININPRLTRVRDPHIRISGFTAGALGVACNAVNAISDCMVYVTIAVEICRLGEVMYNDLKNRGTMDRTVKTAASMAGGWAAAKCGAIAGTKVGLGLGGLIGLIFGPAGVVVFGALGSMVGGVVGAIWCAQIGRRVAEQNYKYAWYLMPASMASSIYELLATRVAAVGNSVL